MTFSTAHPPRCLVSACLLGLCTRYDGKSKPSSACVQHLAPFHWIPVCPEQLGGLPTPRSPAQLIDGDGHAVLAGTARVIDKQGIDRTSAFIQGAHMVLSLAQMQQVTYAFFKARSPSCGLSPTAGVTTALLQQHGIEVISF
nr:DUF523 domain-containing protein [uncultured Desulfobulbus sp.]